MDQIVQQSFRHLCTGKQVKPNRCFSLFRKQDRITPADRNLCQVGQQNQAEPKLACLSQYKPNLSLHRSSAQTSRAQILFIQTRFFLHPRALVQYENIHIIQHIHFLHPQHFSLAYKYFSKCHNYIDVAQSIITLKILLFDLIVVQGFRVISYRPIIKHLCGLDNHC